MRSFKVVLILLFLFMVGACSQAQQMPKDVYKTSVKIELKLKNPNYNRVLELLEKAKTEYPDDPEIWFLLGKVYGIKGRYKDMLDAFTQANKYSPKEKDKAEMKKLMAETFGTTFNQAVDYAKQVNTIERYGEETSADWSKYQVYCDSLEKIASRFPDSSYNWKACSSSGQLPLAPLKQHLFEKALELYELDMQLDSTRYEPFVNAGFVASRLKLSDKSLVYFKKAYELKPDDPDVLGNYFAALSNNKQYEEALKVSDDILRINPDNINVLFNRAIILENLGREQETLDLYNKIVEKDSNARDAFFNRGLWFLNQTGKIAKQLIGLRDSLQSNPNSSALIDRSNQLIKEQKTYFNEAESDFKRVHELAPDDLEATKFLGYCYLNEEKVGDAITTLEELVKKEPDNKEAWGYLSIAYAKKGLVDKAKDAEKKAQ